MLKRTLIDQPGQLINARVSVGGNRTLVAKMERVQDLLSELYDEIVSDNWSMNG